MALPVRSQPSHSWAVSMVATIWSHEMIAVAIEVSSTPVNGVVRSAKVWMPRRRLSRRPVPLNRPEYVEAMVTITASWAIDRIPPPSVIPWMVALPLW